MKCLYCRGQLVQKQVSYAANRKGYHLIIDDVPAWVCEQCGEVTFSRETTEKICRMVHSEAEPIRTVSLNVFAFS